MTSPSKHSHTRVIFGSLQTHFVALSEVLYHHESVWKPTPFSHRELPWLPEYPSLVHYLSKLSPPQIDALDKDMDTCVREIEPFFPEAPWIHHLGQLPPLEQMHPPVSPSSTFVGISPEKMAQIQAFTACIPSLPLPLLEWCSGKGHLGRYLATLYHQPVLCLEKQEQLCAEGAHQAQQEGLPVCYQTIDVIEPHAAECLQPEQHIVALHACGQLHRRLLTLAVQKNVYCLSVAPCCYHLGESDDYIPYSAAGHQQSLRLASNDLRLATREVVTSRTSRIAQRIHNQQWRMGFDLLQRDLRGIDEYLPAPSVPRSLLHGSFADYCHHLAATKGLTLPSNTPFATYERTGRERYRQAYALELIRSLFRRPLEVWLLLDRALFLQEHGYHVSIGTFCQRHHSPRNLLIQAQSTPIHGTKHGYNPRH